MNIINTSKKTALSLTVALCMISTAQAGPGPLPTTPLFLTNAVEPNIFFTLDDSGSMEGDFMVPSNIPGLPTSNGLPVLGLFPRAYILPIANNGQDINWSYPEHGYTVPSLSVTPNAWMVKNHIGNSLYYNPDVTYKPWAGVDASNNPLFNDANPSNAFGDPSNPGFGSINLTSNITFSTIAVSGYWLVAVNSTIYPATYYEWVDSDGDGVFESTDSYNTIEIKPANAPFPSGRSYTDEINNFANWFQYHRKRSYAAKGVIGRVINDSDATRMGLQLYNGGLKKNAVSMTDSSNKSAILTDLYDTMISCWPGRNYDYPWTCHGTPGRSAVNEVGRLFNGSKSDPTPIQSAADGGECQQNFNVVLSDGFWNGLTAPSGIGNADGDNSSAFDGNSSESNDGGNYEDSYSVTLADVAMHYYENDLSPLADKVPPQEGVDLAEHQHLVTYAIGFGVNGNLDPAVDDPVTGGSNFWPDAITLGGLARIDDLWHAAYNSRGKYLNAQNPAELEQSLLESIQDISSRTATAAAVAVNSARLTSESVVYIAQFNSNRWEGALLAYPIIDLDLGTLSSLPKWEAGEILSKRDIANSPRTMITHNGSAGVPFQWDTSKLSSDMLDDLRTSPSGGTDSDTVAEARLDYMRGDRSNEGTGYNFRTRPGLLADIVNSGPVYVGGATLSWPDSSPFPTTTGSRYSDFKAGIAKSRERIVYVGSNDGMLHAFDDTTGKEVMAYVPQLISSTAADRGLHYLTNGNYAHSWYVDLTPTLSDVYMTTSTGAGWHTVLVGALRGGGRGLFALEVTNPSLFSEANADKIAMWEFSSDDDNDLGYTYSRPAIALTNSGRWMAIFGNGYNDLGSGEASLFVLDIEKGIDGWGPNDYYKFSTQAGDTTNRNGLASPALVDVDGNGTVDRVYAGDLEGNMWVFDMSSSKESDWDYVWYDNKTKEPLPLFTTPTGQPITSKPVLAKHPTIPYDKNANAPNLMVYFGTGQYLVESDKTNTDQQSFYGVWDKGDESIERSANLIEQTFDPSYTNRVITRNFVDYSIDYGWWFDLPDSGERSVTNSIARGDTIFFNTFIPQNNPCSVGGYGFRFSVDMTTGGSPEETVVDFNKDGQIDENDNENTTGVLAAIRQEGFLPEPVFIEDLVFTGPIASKIKALPFNPEGRFSWQELIK